MKPQPMETAPRDGTPILLGGADIGSIFREPYPLVWAYWVQAGFTTKAGWYMPLTDQRWHKEPDFWLPMPTVETQTGASS